MASQHPPFGFEQIADCGALRVVGVRLQPGQRIPEHRTAIPAALIVTEGELRYSEGDAEGSVAAGELLLVNPGERHSYRATVATRAYIVYAGLPGARHRAWALKRR